MEHALELALHPGDLATLTRGLTRTARAVPAAVVWHDTPGHALAGRALALSEERGRWRLMALGPPPGQSWPPGQPAPVLAEADTPDAMPHAIPDGLVPVAVLRGWRRGYTAPHGDAPGVVPGVAVTILDGHVRGVASDHPIVRVTLHGPHPALADVAVALAGSVRLAVPAAGLAATVLAMAQGTAPTHRLPSDAAIQPGQTVSDGMAAVIGRLLDMVLHWSREAAIGATPVGVHQMRVATRRLRSAMTIFRPAACPALDALGPAVRDMAARLGAARDWDVFLDGAGAQVVAAFPDDRRVRILMGAALRRRAAAYADLRQHLASPAYRQMAVALACAAVLRPWDGPGAPPVLTHDIRTFAAAALDRQAKRARHGGRGLTDLPIEALHDLRKCCKRLRYAAEFFLPLYPDRAARRFLKHLASLQEELGALNDSTAAAGLMAQLGRTERGWAAGLVVGYMAAAAAPSRTRIGGAWRRFRKTPVFWA